VGSGVPAAENDQTGRPDRFRCLSARFRTQLSRRQHWWWSIWVRFRSCASSLGWRRAQAVDPRKKAGEDLSRQRRFEFRGQYIYLHPHVTLKSMR
jgi:hypothetical protein